MPALLSTYDPVAVARSIPGGGGWLPVVLHNSSGCPGEVLARRNECLFLDSVFIVYSVDSDCNPNCSLGSLASSLTY